MHRARYTYNRMSVTNWILVQERHSVYMFLDEERVKREYLMQTIMHFATVAFIDAA